MQRVLRVLVAALLCFVLAAPALAEVAFLPEVSSWMLETMPLELTLSADVSAYAPFDEARLPQINSLFRHLALRISWQPLVEETQSTVAVLVDGEEAMSLGLQQTEQGNMLQFSALPNITFAGKDPLASLLGASSEPFTLFGLDGTESAWLEQGYGLLENLEDVLKPYLTSENAVKTQIENMGTARLKQDYTVPKADAPGLTELLAAACPNGRLKELLSGLVFSGKQTLRIYRREDGVPLRVEWNGNCGPDEDHLRDVKLTWRLRRDDLGYRDELSLKSPALRGSDNNRLEWTIGITPNKAGDMVLDCKLEYTETANKQKTTISGSAKLTAASEGEGTRVTGEAKLSHQLPDASDATTYTFAPDLLVSGDGNMPAVDGTLTVASVLGKKTLSEATITLGLHRTGYTSWQMREQTIDLDTLDEGSVEAARQVVERALASSMLRHLLLLPREDLDYLLKDLPEESVQSIINAAQSH